MRVTRVTRAAALVAAAAAAHACAHIESPPGGPEDEEPPTLLVTRPDTMARVPGFRDPVVLVFSEGISEQGLEQAVNVSPRTSPVVVDKSGDEVRVSLRRGWEPNRVYQVTVSTEVQDLFNNRLAAPIRLVFSTGPEIPDTRAAGSVFVRTTGAPAVGARVEAILAPDSLVYATLADSAGGFEFRQVPPGEYLLRAYPDQNRNRALETFEPRDTARVTVTAAAPVAGVLLRTLAPDTTAPVAGTATYANGWVEVRFDDWLDPDQPLDPQQVTLAGPAGPVRVAEVRVGSPPQAARDTAGRDTAARRQLPPARRDTAAAGRDTAAAPRVRPASQSLFVRPAEALAPEADHRVAVTGVRNLNGLVGGGEATFRTSRPAPPPRAPAADSTIVTPPPAAAPPGRP